jgi:hypothetical protein
MDSKVIVGWPSAPNLLTVASVDVGRWFNVPSPVSGAAGWTSLPVCIHAVRAKYGINSGLGFVSADSAMGPLQTYLVE